MLDPRPTASRHAAASHLRLRLRTATVLTVVLVAGLGLSGCSDPPEPAPFDPPTVADTSSSPGESPSQSASPSEIPSPAPTLPDAATGATVESAEAFVRFYIDVINHAARTGDTTAMRQYATAECQGCDAIATSIEAVGAAGGYFDGDIYYEVLDVLEAQSIDQASFALRLTMRTPSGALARSSTDTPTPLDPQPENYGFRVEEIDGLRLITMFARTP